MAGSAAVGLVALRFFEQPLRYLVPPCTLHMLTGLHCPGCGMTRATRALLDGDIAAAWNYNQLYLVALPLLLIFYLQLWLRQRPYRGSGKLGFSVLAIALLYGVLRNIPVAPFTALAPH